MKPNDLLEIGFIRQKKQIAGTHRPAHRAREVDAASILASHALSSLRVIRAVDPAACRSSICPETPPSNPAATRNRAQHDQAASLTPGASACHRHPSPSALTLLISIETALIGQFRVRSESHKAAQICPIAHNRQPPRTSHGERETSGLTHQNGQSALAGERARPTAALS
jgi:hypothetical protein